MAEKIIWSPQAQLSFEEIVVYLETEWGKSSARKFVIKTDRVIQVIAKHPYLFPLSGVLPARRCVINKQVSLYYKTHGSEIHLISFWDNRLNIHT